MTHKSCQTIVPAVNRRRLLTAATAGIAAAAMANKVVSAQEGRAQVRAEAFALTHQPKPLPFDSVSLTGLSQRLIDSHWSNDYGGSVRALNGTKRRLADALADRDLPPYIYNDRKREHLMRTGSVVLHELKAAQESNRESSERGSRNGREST